MEEDVSKFNPTDPLILEPFSPEKHLKMKEFGHLFSLQKHCVSQMPRSTKRIPRRQKVRSVDSCPPGCTGNASVRPEAPVLQCFRYVFILSITFL
jgi:hypothetical protein